MSAARHTSKRPLKLLNESPERADILLQSPRLSRLQQLIQLIVLLLETLDSLCERGSGAV